MPVEPPPSSNSTLNKEPRAHSVLGVAGTFLKLGCFSFGGPIAHLSYFHAEIVEKQQWLDDAHFTDLVALCQFLPGPASSQLVFSLGYLRAGYLGAIVASICFTAPSALLMIAFAYGVATVQGLQNARWVMGLKLAAVTMVAQAVWSMGKKLCTDRLRIGLCTSAAAALLVWPGAATQLVLIALGAFIGWYTYRKQIVIPAVTSDSQPSTNRSVATVALICFFALLVFLPIAARSTQNKSAQLVDSFYRAGSLVFGGGHVVLPLLRAEVVPSGWLSDQQFLAGYGAAQAVPGPLFTFAAYLGASIDLGHPPWLGGLIGLLAIFLPAWLLVAGALPFWQTVRSKPFAQAALMGANAAVVGVLLAALYHPVFTEAVHTPIDLALVLIAFTLVEFGKTPPWLIVTMLGVVNHFLPTR